MQRISRYPIGDGVDLYQYWNGVNSFPRSRYIPAIKKLNSILQQCNPNTLVFEIYMIAEEYDDEEAQYYLGRIYEGGFFGAKKDINLARIWYELAANQGHPDSIFNLSLLKMRHYAGEIREAKKMLIEAVNLGCVNAMFQLARFYSTGEFGFVKNELLSIFLFGQIPYSSDTVCINAITNLIELNSSVGMEKESERWRHMMRNFPFSGSDFPEGS